MNLIRETSNGSNKRLAMALRRVLLQAIRFMFGVAVLFNGALFFRANEAIADGLVKFGQIFVIGVLSVPILRVFVEMRFYLSERRTDRALLSVFTLVAVILVISIRFYTKGA